MDPLIVAVIGLVLMSLLMLLGMPIAFTMLAAGLLGNAYLLSVPAATHLAATNVWEQFSSYGLSVIPLFVLMGQFAYRAGTTERLYRAAYTWVGRMPGGLACTTVAASAGFSAICGSNSATTATMGTIAMPEMRRYGYDPALSSGAIAVGGTLGVVIPPSVVLIVIAVQTEQSLLRLFLAAVIPGLILTALFLLTIVAMCMRNRALGPLGARSSGRCRAWSRRCCCSAWSSAASTWAGSRRPRRAPRAPSVHWRSAWCSAAWISRASSSPSSRACAFRPWWCC
jgi:tripartite ATP-independent transporter DctM subunit